MLNVEISVGQMVAERPGRSRVFEKYRIDYCCGGKLSLSAACARHGINAEDVLAAIRTDDEAAGSEHGEDWSRAPLTDLIDHLLETHHAYLWEALERLSHLSQKVARVHGENHPELVELAQVYAKFAGELGPHMHKEEQVLFPAIRQIAGAASPLGFSVDQPIRVMEHEHDAAGADLVRMRELTNDFQVPEDACNSYRALFDGLAELERDTHMHIHKENNVLFPGAMALAKR